jgi:hypothetical protein
MTPDIVCVVKKEDILRWLASGGKGKGQLSANMDRKINVGYQRVCLKHKIEGLAYHISKPLAAGGNELHTVVARIPLSSKVAPGTGIVVLDLVLVVSMLPHMHPHMHSHMLRNTDSHVRLCIRPTYTLYMHLRSRSKNNR